MLLLVLIACGVAPPAASSRDLTWVEAGDGHVFVDLVAGGTHSWYVRSASAAPGDPWKPLATPSGTVRLTATPGRWLALANDEVHESADQGVTWTATPALPRIVVPDSWPVPPEYVDVDVAPDGRVYATGREAVVRLEDGAWSVVLRQPPSMGDGSYGSWLSDLYFDPFGRAWVTSEPFGLWTWTPDGLPAPAANGLTRPPSSGDVGGTAIVATSDGAIWEAGEYALHRRGASEADFQRVDWSKDALPWGDPMPVHELAADGSSVVATNTVRVARIAPDGTSTDLYVPAAGDPWPIDVVVVEDRVYVGLGGATPNQRALEIGSDGTVTPIGLP